MDSIKGDDKLKGDIMSGINTRLDKIATLNKMVHPELDGACYICGINPNLIKQLMADEFEELIGEEDKLEPFSQSKFDNWVAPREMLRDELRQKLEEWKK